MTQKVLDAIKLIHDPSLDKFKRYEIIPESGLIVNGSMGIIGGTGSGKTSLITKIIKLYKKKIPTIHVIYIGGEIDQTFTTNIPNGLTLVDPSLLKIFLETYSSVKKELIEWINLIEILKKNKTVLFKDLNTNMIKLAKENKITNTDDLLEFALAKIDHYSQPSMIKSINIPPLIVKNNVIETLSIFDDLTQLGKFTSDPSGKFLRMITANTRHFLNTSIFSMQRYTYLPSNVRKNVNCWLFTKGMAMTDIKILLKEINLPEDILESEIIDELNSLEKYEFLTVNAEFNVLQIIHT